jgi:hypothetical protein
MVNFKKAVIEEAELMLLDLSQMSPTHKIITEDKNYFEKIMYILS